MPIFPLPLPPFSPLLAFAVEAEDLAEAGAWYPRVPVHGGALVCRSRVSGSAAAGCRRLRPGFHQPVFELVRVPPACLGAGGPDPITPFPPSLDFWHAGR